MHFEPISLREIQAFKELYQLDMDEFDVDMICQLDDLWQAAQPVPDTKGRR